MEKRKISPLKRARFERGLTQCGLMLRTKINQTKLSLIELGYYPPTPDEAKKISAALRMKVEDVFPGEGGKK